jgi:hypothetical protein
VLDSLYSFQGASPKRVVITDKFSMFWEAVLPPHRSRVDSATLEKYAFTGAQRAPLDPHLKYRLPVAILPADSMPKLEERGIELARKLQIADAFWVAFRETYPGAWGMVGFSRVTFNSAYTQAIVYSNHQCGPYCYSGDTWILERPAQRWRVVERIAREHLRMGEAFPRSQPRVGEVPQPVYNWELEGLRYVGLDAKPNSYRHRMVYEAFANAVTHQPLSFLKVNILRGVGMSRVYTTDSVGRLSLGTVPFDDLVAMIVGCPDQSRPDSIYAGDFRTTAGSDTTIKVSIDFRQCFHVSRDEQVWTLTGAQAFISETEARFIFPRRAASYTWDLPLKGAYPGGAEYMWWLGWAISDARDGKDPLALWLTKRWKSGGPRKGSLDELIAGIPLEPMINCVTCDGAWFGDPDTDHKNVFANVENGQVVFRVRGKEAVRRIFPTIPHTVTFETRVRQVAMPEHGPGDNEESQTVRVNCSNSDSSAASRRRCDVPPNAQAARQTADSTAMRRLQVVVLSYDGASLMRNLDVRIRSEDKKAPSVTRSTGPLGKFSILQSPPDSVTLEVLCPENRRRTHGVSASTSFYLAPGRDTTLQLLVDPQSCSR